MFQLKNILNAMYKIVTNSRVRRTCDHFFGFLVSSCESISIFVMLRLQLPGKRFSILQLQRIIVSSKSKIAPGGHPVVTLRSPSGHPALTWRSPGGHPADTRQSPKYRFMIYKIKSFFIILNEMLNI